MIINKHTLLAFASNANLLFRYTGIGVAYTDVIEHANRLSRTRVGPTFFAPVHRRKGPQECPAKPDVLSACVDILQQKIP